MLYTILLYHDQVLSYSKRNVTASTLKQQSFSSAEGILPRENCCGVCKLITSCSYFSVKSIGANKIYLFVAGWVFILLLLFLGEKKNNQTTFSLILYRD